MVLPVAVLERAPAEPVEPRREIPQSPRSLGASSRDGLLRDGEEANDEEGNGEWGEEEGEEEEEDEEKAVDAEWRR